MMRALSLAEIAQALDAQLAPAALQMAVTGVSTDSRTVQPGDLFVALVGERFDGHAFVSQAAARGAAACVCSRDVETPIPAIRVPDTLLALGTIARLQRMLFDGMLVALTGSAGKTTTKDMIAAILRVDAPVLATTGNLNNEIGVPLTLFGLQPEHRYAVIEMGAGKPGDIAYLASIARPDVALLTNALPAHLERLGSIEEVARTKGAIYEALPADATAVLNIDDDFAASWAQRIAARRVVRVSARGAAAADVRAHGVKFEQGCAAFVLDLPDEQIELQLRVPGVQQVCNAVAAAGVAIALGIPGRCIRAGLESVTPAAGRMQQYFTRAGCSLIDDTYNANPGSVRAAIDTLAQFEGTRVLVLGHMAELGPGAAELHRQIGVLAHERGIERLMATGANAAETAAGFGAGASVFTNREELIAACRAFDREGVVMLVKGSRSARMEDVIAALTDNVPGVARTGTH